MRTLPHLFLVAAAGLSLATFLTSETLAAGTVYVPSVHSN